MYPVPFEKVTGGQPGRIESDVADQANANGYANALITIADWPEVPRRVYFLRYVWGRFISNTLPQWLAHESTEVLDGIFDALTAIEAKSVLTYIRMGLRECLDDGCCGWGVDGTYGPDRPRLLTHIDPGWLEAHTEPSDLSWDTLKTNAGEKLARKKLWPKRAVYIREHRAELVRPRPKRSKAKKPKPKP